MASPEISGLDSSFDNPDEARWHDSVMKSFACDPRYADIYVPNEEDLRYCPDPDPMQFRVKGHISGFRHDATSLYEYVNSVEGAKTVHDLPWAVRYLFSKGYTPDTARVYLGEFALRSLLRMHGRTYDDTYPSFQESARAISTIPIPFDELMGIVESTKTGRPWSRAEAVMVVVRGIQVGRIIQEPEKLRGSISNQLLATVDVGFSVDQELSTQGNPPHLKRIVCAGIPVLQKGDLVSVALPGSLIAKRGKGTEVYKTEKVRARGFHVGRRKYRSEGIILSYLEACGWLGPYKGVFGDIRDAWSREILRIPSYDDLYPGRNLDGTLLGEFGYPMAVRFTEPWLGYAGEEYQDERLRAFAQFMRIIRM